MHSKIAGTPGRGSDLHSRSMERPAFSASLPARPAALTNSKLNV